jgi:hypothetical protein
MHAASNLVNDLILIDQLAAGDEILFDLGFVRPREKSVELADCSMT